MYACRHPGVVSDLGLQAQVVEYRSNFMRNAMAETQVHGVPIVVAASNFPCARPGSTAVAATATRRALADRPGCSRLAAAVAQYQRSCTTPAAARSGAV